MWLCVGRQTRKRGKTMTKQKESLGETMTIFEEQFPSLYKLVQDDDELTNEIYPQHVMECCLDKQRVKEIITEVHNREIDTIGEYPACSKCGEGGDECFMKELFKELDL